MEITFFGKAMRSAPIWSTDTGRTTGFIPRISRNGGSSTKGCITIIASLWTWEKPSGCVLTLLILPLKCLSFQKAIIVDKKETVPENLVDDAHEVYETLNKFLEQTNYIAGEKVTIADFSTVTTVTAFELFVPIDEEKYPKLIAWIKRMQKLPCYRVNEAGFKEMQKYVQNAWKKWLFVLAI